MKGQMIPTNSFDFIRLFFASLVVFAHFFVLSEVENLRFLIPIFNTTVAVMGFFILSGFLVTTSYFRSKNLKIYFIKRAKRLLPAYIFVLILAVVLGAIFGEMNVIHYIAHPLVYKYFVCNLGFANFLQPELPGLFQDRMIAAVNGSLWTIKIEVAFYLVLPIILFFLEKLPNLQAKNKVIIIGFFLLVSINFILKTQMEPNPFSLIYQKQLPGKLHYFLVGILAYYNLNWVIKNLNSIGLIGLFLFLEKFLFETDFLWAFGLGALIFYVGFKYIFFNKVTIFGDISYGLYLYHFLICQLVFTQLPHLNLMIQLILVILLSSTLALFSYHYIEKKFIK